jgi:hypothetical protein
MILDNKHTKMDMITEMRDYDAEILLLEVGNPSADSIADIRVIGCAIKLQIVT